MLKNLIYLSAIAFLTLGSAAQAFDNLVVNGSFEQPGTEIIKGWNGEGVSGTPAVDIPGWSSDTVVVDSGVETDWTATDGDWTAFLKGADPSVWQLTSYVVEANDILALSVNTRNTLNATTLEMTLYVDANGVRMPVVTQDVALTDTMQSFTLLLNAGNDPNIVGKLVGVEFNNVTDDGESWVGIDEVVLKKVAPKIEWITDTIDYDGDGVQDDQGWIDLLTHAGYDVEVRPGRYTALGNELYYHDANDYAGELNAVDLIIISRSANHAKYVGITAWNGLQTPILCLNAYQVGINRFKWIDSSWVTVDNTLSYMEVKDVNHPIFSGVTMEEGFVDMVDPNIFGEGYPGTNFLDATDMGNATVIGTHLLGYPWIAEWDPGVEYYDGAGQIAGGKRMVFMAGTQQPWDGHKYPEGALNLTEAGQQVFLNAVAYMLQFKPIDPGTNDLTHLYTFEDGTADDLVGNADGIPVGDTSFVNGAFVTNTQDAHLELPAGVIDINSYNAVTLECWYTPKDGANTSASMLTYFGDTAGGVGANGLFMASARTDDVSRTAISCGNLTAPYESETGVNGPEYDDGLLHHMVSTLDANEITLYMDGQLIGTALLAENNQLGNLSNNVAYLAKSGYTDDPTWIGAIHKFAIYDRTLSPQEVLYLYLQGE